jgi:NAD(P)-dependent dehydrogenase (short-subunit alcohol dehydrogenase family)
MPTSLSGSVVLVTGANGGLGREFVAQALSLGAAKVYATARTPLAADEWADARIVPLALDVTSEASVAAAAAAASDTTVVINNAAISNRVDSLLEAPFDDIRNTFETNFFGAVTVARAFAPVVEANGGGGFLHVQSALSWVAFPFHGAYSASKSAFWSASNSMRLELAPRGIQVTSLHLGYADTPMTEGIDSPKNDPADVVRDALAGFEAGEHEVLADDLSVTVKRSLSTRVEEIYPALASA